jgi:DNA-binding transcriptional MocR family regulator
VEIPTDTDGLIPDALGHILDNWDTKTSGGAKPRILYCIPTGGNPSGATLSMPRRQALMALASKHDLILIEDDPYYFMEFEEKTGPDKKQSLFSLDTEVSVCHLPTRCFVLGSPSQPFFFVQVNSIYPFSLSLRPHRAALYGQIASRRSSALGCGWEW